MTRIKICGIREKVHALAAFEAGANLIGLVFAPSQRQVTLAQAQEIASTIKEHGDTTEVVGVFVDMSASEVNEIAHSCELDWVQLSGNEPWTYCQQINKPIIKAIRIRQGQQPEEICDHLAAGTRALSSQRYAYLFDSTAKGKYGGTGMTFDWNLVRQAAEQFPVIIAGGLTPENVTQAIEMIAPWGVDVSSGVEVDGAKDIAKIKAFVAAVRRADDNKK